MRRAAILALAAVGIFGTADLRALTFETRTGPVPTIDQRLDDLHRRRPVRPRAHRPVRPHRPERPERPERRVRPDRPARIARPDRPERPVRGERPVRPVVGR